MTLYWSDGVLLPQTEVAVGEQKDHFTRAVVRVATMAAEAGAPMQLQRRVLGWQLDEIAKDTGRRPSERDVKEALHAALPAKLLCYLRGSTHRVAGYYPPDTEKAEELARIAKREQSKTGGDNG
jgi:hypothetical protein